MSHYLVTGRAGSGKSAVTEELKKRRIAAYDADEIPGLCHWVDLASGLPVNFTDQRYIDLDKNRFNWNADKLKELLSSHENLFLCGGSDNDLSFTDLFYKSFVLDVNPDIQISRLSNRTNNEYGTDPRMFPRIIADQQSHVAKAKELGAIVIDANEPIEKVVDEILSYVS